MDSSNDMKLPSIALVTLDYPPQVGGVARYLGNLVEASEGGIDVFVPQGHLCDGPGSVQIVSAFTNGWWSWRALVRDCYRMQEKGYSHLLISHVLPVGTAAWIARWFGGLAYSVMIHGLDIRLAGRHGRRRWIAGRVLRGAARVIANSHVVAKEAQAIWPDLRVEVLTPGVEPRSFLSREEARKKLGIDPSARVSLTVARLVPRKGIDTMIRVLERHPDWTYVVVGSGKDEARLRALADVHAMYRVRFITAATDEVRDCWYAAADLFVFLARQTEDDIEGFGIALLEAGLARLPVLAGRSGGVIEAVLHEKTGLLVDPEDIDAIDQGFTKLANDAALRETLGRAGCVRAKEDFAWKPRWERLQTWMTHL